MAKLHTWLGVPVVILSGFAGSAIFGSVASDPALLWRILTGFVSVGAGIVATFQTFFAFSDRASRHRQAGADYAALKRELDLFLVRINAGNVESRVAADELRRLARTISELEKTSLHVPDELYDAARREEAVDLEGV